MKYFVFILFLVIMTACASSPAIYRKCKQVGQDSSGDILFESCEKLK